MNKKRSWTDWKSCWASRTFRSKITVESLSNVSKTHQVNRLIRCPMKILEAVINLALACQYILYLNAILSSFTKRSLRSSFSLVCENIFFLREAYHKSIQRVIRFLATLTFRMHLVSSKLQVNVLTPPHPSTVPVFQGLLYFLSLQVLPPNPE